MSGRESESAQPLLSDGGAPLPLRNLISPGVDLRLGSRTFGHAGRRQSSSKCCDFADLQPKQKLFGVIVILSATVAMCYFLGAGYRREPGSLTSNATHTTSSSPSTAGGKSRNSSRNFRSTAPPPPPPPPKVSKILLMGYSGDGLSAMASLFDLQEGGLLFRQPVPAVLQHLYAIPQDQLDPLRVSFLPDYSFREPRPEERSAVLAVLAELLNCRTDLLPPEVLLSRNMEQLPQLKLHETYTHCLQVEFNSHSWRNVSALKCDGLAVCPPPPIRREHAQCFDDLRRAELAEAHRRTDRMPRKDFLAYVDCYQKQFQRLGVCRDVLRRICIQSILRAVTLQYVPVRQVAPLLEAIPDLVVVLILQDPRALATSSSPSTQSTPPSPSSSSSEAVAIARLWCRLLSRDYRDIYAISSLYPGRVHYVRLESLALDPHAHVHIFERLLHVRFSPTAVTGFVRAMTSHRMREGDWKHRMTVDQLIRVGRECRDEIGLLDYPKVH